MNKKRQWIEALPSDLTEREFMKRVCSEAEKWKVELEKSAESVLKEEMAERRKNIEDVVKKRVDEEKTKKDGVLSVLMSVVRSDLALDEWIALPSKDRFWGSCFRRDIGGRCHDHVEYINVLLPRVCEGGVNEDDGSDNSLAYYCNTYDENFVCKKHYDLRHRENIYKRNYLPKLMKTLGMDDS